MELWSNGVMMNFSRMKQDNCTGVLSIKPQKDIVVHDALKEQYFLIWCSLFTIMRFLKRFIQLDNKLLRCFFITQYSTTPLLHHPKYLIHR